MNPLVVRSRVDGDGMVRVIVPVGKSEAEREVQVTIESLPAAPLPQENYVAWLEGIFGRWEGDFERLPQGEFERRDEL
jgi:hypothetical protein